MIDFIRKYPDISSIKTQMYWGPNNLFYCMGYKITCSHLHFKLWRWVECLRREQERGLDLAACLICLGFPGGASGKESTCQCCRLNRAGFAPWVGKPPWRRKWQPPPGFLPGKYYEQGSLVGYSPRGHKESDKAEHKNLIII